MASIGHLAVGAAIGAVYSRRTGTNPKIAILTFAGLALAPDLDLVSGVFGVTPNTPLSHRGITHSVFFAMAVGTLVGGVLRGSSLRSFLTGFAVFAAMSSHGLLDTMSRLGNGPMLFWPFAVVSYEFPWRPIPGVLSAGHYLTLQAVPTLAVESLIFLPFIAYATVVFFPRRVEKRPAEEAITGG
jgi:inner membrane protein